MNDDKIERPERPERPTRPVGKDDTRPDRAARLDRHRSKIGTIVMYMASAEEKLPAASPCAAIITELADDGSFAMTLFPPGRMFLFRKGVRHLDDELLDLPAEPAYFIWQDEVDE